MKNRVSNLASELKASRSSYAMMAPFLVFFIVFTIIPVFTAICLSFTNFNMLQFPKFMGLTNYKRMLLNDSVFMEVLKNTIVFAFITGPLSYVMSFMLAWLINEMNKNIRTFLTFIFYGPVLGGDIYFIWNYIFSGDSYGILNGFLMNSGLIHEPVQFLSDSKTMLVSIVIVQLWASLGVGFLAFIAGFQSMDNSYFEAAAIDGVRNRWQELWYVTLPSMAPQLMFGAIMQISASFSVGTIVETLAGFPTTDYSADTIITYMQDVGTVRYEMGYASAIAVFLFAMMLITNAVIQKILKKYSTD